MKNVKFKKDAIVKEKDAVKVMREIGVDPKGIKIMNEKSIFRLVRLNGIRAPMANIIKEDMLSAGGEAAIHKLTCACRVDHTDILLMGTILQYRHLIADLNKQPYSGREIAGRISRLLF